MQFGLEQHGFTRFLPLADNQPNSPPYDPRSSSWYRRGKGAKSYSSVYFQPPKTNTYGSIVQTGLIPIQTRGTFVGVVDFNYLTNRLSKGINSNPILSSGYYYMIDTNSSALINHPNFSPSCSNIKCAEGFSESEFASFSTSVLLPLRLHTIHSGSSVIYTKQGLAWRLTVSAATYGTIDYTVIGTVLNSEIEEASTATTQSINKTVVYMEISFAFCIFAILIILVLYSQKMITLIVNPVNDLRAVFTFIRSDNLTCEIPKKASSADMKVLLNTFSRVCTNIAYFFSY